MRFNSLRDAFGLTALLWAFTVRAVPTPATHHTVTSGCHVQVPGHVSDHHTIGPVSSSCIFGVSVRLPSILQLRGGQVLEPETLDEVESILLRSALEQKLVVVDFSATWCGPCKMIAPLYHELSEQIQDVVFLKVDVDENPDTAAKYNVSAMPTFVFIKAGEVVDRLMGADPSRLQELINEHK